MKNEPLLIIGDVHGKINEYWKILNKWKQNTIQVGDFGFSKEHIWHLKNIDPQKNKINFGNHDDYYFLDRPHSLNDFSFKDGIMTVRGAYSVDKAERTEGIDWWANEELTYQQMGYAVNQYAEFEPKIMITHDCPHSVREALFHIQDKSLTTNGLEAMFQLHQPDLWIFGHHHKSVNELINGTRFICLAELETFKL